MLKPKRGRPPHPKETKRRKQIGVRVTDAELAVIKGRAAQAKQPPSSYLRTKGMA